MKYKVVPLNIELNFRKIGVKINEITSLEERPKLAAAAALEFEKVLNEQAKSNWMFQSTEQINCLIGGGPYYVAIFTEQPKP